MEIRETTPAEAYETLQRDPNAIYLDVRTEGEYEAGHPATARNVPIIVFDPASRQPRPNTDFLPTVERHVAHTAKVLVGCQSGVRSLRACELLLDAGYTDVTNVAGGFGGAHDASGRVVVPGWHASGLPVETGQTPGRSYAELRGR